MPDHDAVDRPIPGHSDYVQLGFCGCGIEFAVHTMRGPYIAVFSTVASRGYRYTVRSRTSDDPVGGMVYVGRGVTDDSRRQDVVRRASTLNRAWAHGMVYGLMSTGMSEADAEARLEALCFGPCQPTPA